MIFIKIFHPMLEISLILATIQKIIHRGLRLGLIKKVIGMFKDEAGGLVISEFVGLRAKLYSFKMLKTTAEIFEEKKYKRIKKAVVKKTYNIQCLQAVFI